MVHPTVQRAASAIAAHCIGHRSALHRASQRTAFSFVPQGPVPSGAAHLLFHRIYDVVLAHISFGHLALAVQGEEQSSVASRLPLEQ